MSRDEKRLLAIIIITFCAAVVLTGCVKKREYYDTYEAAPAAAPEYNHGSM